MKAKTEPAEKEPGEEFCFWGYEASPTTIVVDHDDIDNYLNF